MAGYGWRATGPGAAIPGGGCGSRARHRSDCRISVSLFGGDAAVHRHRCAGSCRITPALPCRRASMVISGLSCAASCSPSIIRGVTAARLVTLLRGFGIVISKRQVVRLLIDGKQSFLDEARAVLRAGLTNAAWITVDATGARHKAKNGFCTQIGNAQFAWFGTTGSKSRLNFLELLRAGHGDYVVNDEALAYMRARALAGPVIARLSEHENRVFADRAAWNAHLERLGVAALKVHPDPVLIATEGALWGSVKAHGLLADTVIVSDDAGQFNVGQHGLCWVHAERLVHKLDTFTDAQRAAQRRIRALIWRCYRSLKAWRRHPSPARKATLSARFDHIFGCKTGFATLDRLLARLRANKSKLRRVLERPEIPLNTNGSETDIRRQVTKRKISGGTRARPRFEAAPLFGVGVKFPARRETFPARSLLGAKKFPARPHREFLLSTLKSKPFFYALFPERGRIPCKFTARREFFPSPAAPPIAHFPNPPNWPIPSAACIGAGSPAARETVAT